MPAAYAPSMKLHKYKIAKMKNQKYSSNPPTDQKYITLDLKIK